MSRASGVDGGVSDDEARQMFEAASQDLQAAMDELPPISTLPDAQRAEILETLSALRAAGQRLRQQVMDTAT